MSARASEDKVVLEFMKVKQPLIEDVISGRCGFSCLYLLSDASRAITGQVLCVDAGWSIV
jgi:enoyl-[acyl-carrier-protein] reductase (NADH)